MCWFVLEGNETRFTYDSLGRLRQTVRLTPEYAADVVTSQSWDDNSRLKTQTDPNGNVTAYTYDDQNRLEGVTYADGTEVQYGYDSFGNEMTKVDANGTEVASAYDALNRLTGQTITPADPSIQGTTFETFKYDSLSNTIQAENDFATVTRAFDSMSNLRAETVEFAGDGFTKTIGFDYDGMGNRTGTQYPGGRTVSYTRDDLERVRDIESDQGGDANGLLARYDYLGARRVERRTLAGNGTQLDYGFDAIGRVNATVHRLTGTSAVLDERSYVWDRANNKTQRVEWDGAAALKTHDYAYDSLNRLVESTRTTTGAPVVTAYNLDGAGNRNEVAVDAVVESYTQIATAPVPADAQMNQYTLAPGDTTDRLYDENGNLRETDQAVFRHDYRDRIVDMDDDSTYAVYLYDALGRRIEKSVDDGTTATTTRYVHDGARVAEEWDVPTAGAPTLSATYVYGPYIDEVLTMRRGGVDFYYHADDQHNVVKLTDNTGALLEAYDYGDYGQPEFYDATGTPLTATAYATPYLFTGRAWDAELGYYYFRNRYLDPIHGRFASRDPLGLWGDPLNLGNGYTYAGSNPWSLA